MTAGHTFVQGQDGADMVATLTLSPGCILEFGNNYLMIGHSSNSNYPGALNAIGHDTSRIIFTSSKTTPYAGDWYGIYFADYAEDSICIMKYCDIKYGGYSSYDNINCNNSAITMVNCDISYGNGSGVNLYNSSGATFRNCFIHDNTNNGIYCYDSDPSILNCDITNHSNTGFSNTGSSGPNLFNNIFYGNNEAIYSDVQISGLSSNLFYANTHNYVGSPPTGFGSITTTNINGDPCDIYLNLFQDPNCIDPTLRNYRLYGNSVCVDAGDPTVYSSAHPYDLDGHPRIMEARIDIGAYEFGIFWEGDVNSNWHLPANWSNNSVPDLLSTVNIWPDYVNPPVISSNAQCKDLILWDGTTVEVTGGAMLTVE